MFKMFNLSDLTFRLGRSFPQMTTPLPKLRIQQCNPAELRDRQLPRADSPFFQFAKGLTFSGLLKSAVPVSQKDQNRIN